jgi:diguanylate cyclase (GGDEF)-like protein/PAS domain S-box-containing protein
MMGGGAGENRVLVLDDEVAILDVVKQQLSLAGISSDVEASPASALDRLEANGYALLITDLRMHGMDGIEMTRRAKAVCDDLSVIVMTGLSEVSLAVDAMRAGADDYILKPFEQDELVLSVRRALEKRELALKAQRYERDLERRVNEATRQLRETNQVLMRTQQYLNNLLESTVDCIITFAPDDSITFANRGAQRMLGYHGEELAGLSMIGLCSGGPEEVRYLKRVLSPENPLQNYETEVRQKSGEFISVNMSLSAVTGAEGKIDAYLAICKDITEQKRLETELKEQSIRDGLTGLYNVRYFYERLEGEVERAKRQGHPLSLLLLDIDRFKGYNDAHGHLEGDQVLKGVAECIEDSTREHVDMGFRYGGDEFTVVLPEASKETALGIGNRIRELFASKRYDLLTLSIGLMTYNERYSTRTFIQLTDSMMYDAKRSGGNRVYVYEANDLGAAVSEPSESQRGH